MNQNFDHLRAATAASILEALSTGGRAAVTVRSKESGQHVSVVLSVRKRKPGGTGWVSRGTKAGRVGLADGDVVEIRDPSVDYPDNYVGRLYLADREWRAGGSADPIRVWVADRVLRFALAGEEGLAEQADVFVATECCYCGKSLRDPESIERGVGPECYGKRTKSKRAKDQLALADERAAHESESSHAFPAYCVI